MVTRLNTSGEGYTTYEPGDRVEIALPSTYWTTESFEIIQKARSNFVFFFLQTTFKTKSGERVFAPVDIHAKLMMIDDLWYTIGSANINDRSFEVDGEINVSVQDKSIKDLRKKVWEQHLGVDCPDDIEKAAQLWVKHANVNHKAWVKKKLPASKIFPYSQKGPLLPVTWRKLF